MNQTRLGAGKRRHQPKIKARINAYSMPGGAYYSAFEGYLQARIPNQRGTDHSHEDQF